MNNDLISREALTEEMRKSINERYPKWDKPITVANIATLIFDVIDSAQSVEANWRFYYDHGYKQAERDLKRTQGEKEPVFKSVPTYRKYEDYHDAEQYTRGWNDAMRFIFGIEDK